MWLAETWDFECDWFGGYRMAVPLYLKQKNSSVFECTIHCDSHLWCHPDTRIYRLRDREWLPKIVKHVITILSRCKELVVQGGRGFSSPESPLQICNLYTTWNWTLYKAWKLGSAKDVSNVISPPAPVRQAAGVLNRQRWQKLVV